MIENKPQCSAYTRPRKANHVIEEEAIKSGVNK
jgi:hypothetical protein